MCDYSLEGLASRQAKVGDSLVSNEFPNTYTRGFADPQDPKVAVCLMPGAELKISDPILVDRTGLFADLLYFSLRLTLPPKRYAGGLARFRKVNEDDPEAHHDALELPSGRIVLLDHLRVGQKATVLQLPVSPGKVRRDRAQPANSAAAPRPTHA